TRGFAARRRTSRRHPGETRNQGLFRRGNRQTASRFNQLWLRALGRCRRFPFWSRRSRRRSFETRRQSLLLHLLRRRRRHCEILSNRDVSALALHNFVDHVLFFFLLDGFARLILWRFWRSERIRRAAGRNQDVPRVDLFIRLSVFGFGAPLFDFDYVKAKLALDEVANLARLQSERGLIELRHHLPMTEPAQIAASILAYGNGGIFFRECGQILARARPPRASFGL